MKKQQKEYDKKDDAILYKTLRVSIKAAEEGEGIVEAIVSVFGNVDSYGDIIEKGAFLESLNFKYPKGVWMHDWSQPIAKTVEAKELDEGLYIKGKLILDVQKAKEAYALIKEGVIDEFSIGYTVLEDEYDLDGYRHLKKIRLYEWSPVLVGANPKTRVIDVKTEQKDTEEEDGKPDEEEVTPEAQNEDLGDDKTEDEEVTASESSEQPAIETAPPAEEQKPEGDEEKAGRVLSEKNRALINDSIEQMTNLKNALSNAINPLKELLNAKSTGEKVDNEPSVVDKKTMLRLRESAKQADRAIEYVLKVTK